MSAVCFQVPTTDAATVAMWGAQKSGRLLAMRIWLRPMPGDRVASADTTLARGKIQSLRAHRGQVQTYIVSSRAPRA